MANVLPPDAIKIGLVLFLTFLLGLEREEHRQEGRFNFGGVRTFPLIGLFAYGLSALSDNVLPLAAGTLAVGAVVTVAYLHKLKVNPNAGVTSEVCVFVAFTIGALISRGNYWTGTAMTVSALLLLELKTFLERLATRIEADEIVAFTKFLLLAAVILPIVPNESYTQFHINPFKTWLVVVAVCGVSYASYVLQKLLGERGGVLLVALLGGAYSSTVTVIALARQSPGAKAPRLLAGGMVVSSGITYARILLLVWLFNHALGALLAPWFLGLTLLACLGGFLLARTGHAQSPDASATSAKKNPLELRSAFFFATIFLLMMVVTQAAIGGVGSGALYALAGLMGLSDVAPFVMSIAQSDPAQLSILVAAASVIIAVASNNVVKGGYAFAFAEKNTGRLGLALHVALAALGLVPLIRVL